MTVQALLGKGMRDPDGDGDYETYQKRPYGSWHEEPDPGFYDVNSYANLWPIGVMSCQLYDSTYSVDGGHKWVAHARGDWTAMITVSYGLKQNTWDATDPDTGVLIDITPSHYVIDPDFVDSDDLGGKDHLKLNMAEQDPSKPGEETKIVYMVSCMGDDSEAAGALLKQATIFSAGVAVAGIGSLAGGVTIAAGVTVGTVAEWVGAGISVSELVSAGMKSLDDRVDETAFAKQTGNVCIQSVITRAPFSGSSTPDDDWAHSELAPGLTDSGNSNASFFGEVLAGDKVSVSLEVSQNIYAESRNWVDVWLQQETTFAREMKSSGTVEWVSATE